MRAHDRQVREPEKVVHLNNAFDPRPFLLHRIPLSAQRLSETL
jgi:hypothetical protein